MEKRSDVVNYRVQYYIFENWTEHSYMMCVWRNHVKMEVD